MIKSLHSSPPLVMEEVTDPEEIANAQEQDVRAKRNSDWLEAHAQEIYTQHRGKVIVVAGQELFIADTPQAALSLARAAHPEDNGCLLRYIPKERRARIYALQRRAISPA